MIFMNLPSCMVASPRHYCAPREPYGRRRGGVRTPLRRARPRNRRCSCGRVRHGCPSRSRADSTLDRRAAWRGQPAGLIARRPAGLSTRSIATRPSLAPPLRAGATTVVARFARPMARARQPFSIQHSALPARRAGSGERPAIIQHSALSIQHCPRNARAASRHPSRRPHAIILRPFGSLPNSSTTQTSPMVIRRLRSFVPKH